MLTSVLFYLESQELRPRAHAGSGAHSPTRRDSETARPCGTHHPTVPSQKPEGAGHLQRGERWGEAQSRFLETSAHSLVTPPNQSSVGWCWYYFCWSVEITLFFIPSDLGEKILTSGFILASHSRIPTESVTLLSYPRERSWAALNMPLLFFTSHLSLGLTPALFTVT